ncbi:hypothetical protein MK805_05335 [Shimazuella sp. AN120528]|uniref:hypothetical protein n=1 Tax=Shimazuella soli TaxID=1892854 RepID=UPI001F0E05EF|nr:hypothetical protein [Shimazuella soli]MCH5584390.1 hypothetical protein [Shimazuella soli]
MKVTYLLLTFVLVGCMGLVGCSTSTNPTSTTQTPVKEESAVKIKTGTTKMLDITADLKKAMDAGDQAKVKSYGPKLEEAWSSFEDKVKVKYPELYTKIEDALDPTIAGTEANPLDKAAVSKLNDQLTDALNELVSKEK